MMMPNIEPSASRQGNESSIAHLWSNAYEPSYLPKHGDICSHEVGVQKPRIGHPKSMLESNTKSVSDQLSADENRALSVAHANEASPSFGRI